MSFANNIMEILETAITQLGKEEVPRGSNWGVDIKKYLNSVGINFPASWCMAFVYWCVKSTCKANNSVNPMIKTGGVLKQWQKINPSFKVSVTETPKRNDIFIMDLGHGLGHTGIIEEVEDDIIHTIEGNTNDSGSREGYEVCRRTRKKSTIIGYIRLPIESAL